MSAAGAMNHKSTKPQQTLDEVLMDFDVFDCAERHLVCCSPEPPRLEDQPLIGDSDLGGRHPHYRRGDPDEWNDQPPQSDCQNTHGRPLQGMKMRVGQNDFICAKGFGDVGAIHFVAMG